MRRIIIKRWSTFAVVKCLFIVSAGAEIAHMSGKRSRYRTSLTTLALSNFF
jgi:hypothetical protein